MSTTHVFNLKMEQISYVVAISHHRFDGIKLNRIKTKIKKSDKYNSQFYEILSFTAFIPFGRQHGDRYVAIGDDVAECFPVSQNFPLFTTKYHKQICVSLILHFNYT